MAIDKGKLHEFLGRFVTDLGAVVAAGNVVIGHWLGLYRALASGPATGRCSARTVRRSGRFTLARPLGRGQPRPVSCRWPACRHGPQRPVETTPIPRAAPVDPTEATVRRARPDGGRNGLSHQTPAMHKMRLATCLASLGPASPGCWRVPSWRRPGCCQARLPRTSCTCRGPRIRVHPGPVGVPR